MSNNSENRTEAEQRRARVNLEEAEQWAQLSLEERVEYLHDTQREIIDLIASHGEKFDTCYDNFHRMLDRIKKNTELIDRVDDRVDTLAKKRKLWR